MMAKIVKGSDFKGVVDYIIDKKKDTQIVASEGLFMENLETIAMSFNAQSRMNDKVTKPVGHIALSFSKEDELRLTNRIMAGIATEWGLVSPWSLAKFDNTVIGLFKNELGQSMIAKLNGYTPQKISTPDLDAILGSYASVSDATGYSYMLGGHQMYVISFPSAGYTWMYDGSTGFWNKLKSANITRHRGEFAFQFLNSIIVAVYTRGRLYHLS